MFKIKTIRSASKRFKKTGKGSFKYKHTNLNHLLTKKSRKRKRHLHTKAILASKRNLRSVNICLPYV